MDLGLLAGGGWLFSCEEPTSSCKCRAKMNTSNGDAPSMSGSFNLNATTSPNRHYTHSSPDDSPRTDASQMETPVDLNGLKPSIENRSSQQFCLRWNNHQVSDASDWPSTLCAFSRRSTDGHRQLQSNCIPTPILLRRIFLLWLLQNALACLIEKRSLRLIFPWNKKRKRRRRTAQTDRDLTFFQK